jgi:hypothetical protein
MMATLPPVSGHHADRLVKVGKNIEPQTPSGVSGMRENRSLKIGIPDAQSRPKNARGDAIAEML